MGSDESHFHVSLSQKRASTNYNLFEEKGKPKRNRTEVLSAYQPNTLPPGQTGSRPAAHSTTKFITTVNKTTDHDGEDDGDGLDGLDDPQHDEADHLDGCEDVHALDGHVTQVGGVRLVLGRLEDQQDAVDELSTQTTGKMLRIQNRYRL